MVNGEFCSGRALLKSQNLNSILCYNSKLNVKYYSGLAPSTRENSHKHCSRWGRFYKNLLRKRRRKNLKSNNDNNNNNGNENCLPGTDSRLSSHKTSWQSWILATENSLSTISLLFQFRWRKKARFGDFYENQIEISKFAMERKLFNKSNICRNKI